MAHPKVIEARKAEAQQQIAADVAELKEKLDRLMVFLNVPAPVKAEPEAEVKADADAEPEAEAKPSKAKKASAS